MICLKIISERIYPRPYLGYKVGKMYLGLDIHKNICVVTQMNEQGKVVRKEKIGVDKEEIEDFFFSIERALGQNSTLVFEYDPKALREAQKASGRGMKGVEIEKLEERLQMR